MNLRRFVAATSLMWLLVSATGIKPGHAADRIVLEVSTVSSLEKLDSVFWCVPEEMRSARSFQLTSLASGARVPVQRLTGESDRIMWLLEEPLAAGATRRYQLIAVVSPDDHAGSQDAVLCEDDGKRLVVNVAGRPVLQYNSAVVEPPSGIARHFRRSGYLHPVFAPSGAIVTDDFAPDHAHQHGIFFAWVSTSFQEHEVDFWNQAKGQGNVEHEQVRNTSGGPVWGGFQVRLRHLDLTADGGPLPVLQESWSVRVHGRTDVFVFDLESRQRCVADAPLRINEFHYGGMALRGSRQWYSRAAERSSSADAIPGNFITSEGKHREDGNHTRPDWVSVYGPIGDGRSTITVMSHPENFRHPQPVRLHPTKPYFCFAPMVLGAFEIAPGGTYVSRYRYLIYDGPPDTERNRRMWQAYADPPRVQRVTP